MGHHGLGLGLGSATVMNSDELNNVFSPSPRATPAAPAGHRGHENGRVDAEAHTQAMHIHYNVEFTSKRSRYAGESDLQDRFLHNGECYKYTFILPVSGRVFPVHSFGVTALISYDCTPTV